MIFIFKSDVFEGKKNEQKVFHLFFEFSTASNRYFEKFDFFDDGLGKKNCDKVKVHHRPQF